MVCVPCIFLPILLAIYLKFIQPFILKYLPERWIHFLDPILYPTCPVQMPANAPATEAKEGENATKAECCAAAGDSKKDD